MSLQHWPSLQWLIKTRCNCIVMVIRGFLTRCISPVNMMGLLIFLCFTILSALLCSHDVTNNAVQPPVINNHLEDNDNAPQEDTQPIDSRLQIEYVPRDNLAEKIAQYQKTIQHLKEEVELIHERCKKSEIHLMKLVHLGFQTLETNHHLELKREIDQFQVITKKLIQQELDTYDADKIGITDFALSALGARIVGTIDTKQYVSHHIDLGIYKFPLNTGKYSPSNIIQPWAEIGNCWAFVGSTGKVVIELATLVRIRGVTMEHISPKVTLFGSIDSAPKEFTVLGMNGSAIKENDDLESLGTFQYDSKGQQRQTFWGNVSKIPYRFILLWIHTNHGNTELTCVHRFRVHGDPTDITSQL